ncbi:hypothetical protein [Paludisphaera rhizosphaerae]|uniref:hypothetical protein n=1 Tax=Paludisphaera rhizosphaerae TaxID=2711216 RepID=UPI00197DAA02|nr:hypothetical protein [Paludisphaera rhizosphaerae]
MLMLAAWTNRVAAKGDLGRMSDRSRKPLFERLKQSLEDGIAHARGDIFLREHSLGMEESKSKDDEKGSPV